MNGKVCSEYTPVGQKRHKNQENDQWRLFRDELQLEVVTSKLKQLHSHLSLFLIYKSFAYENKTLLTYLLTYSIFKVASCIVENAQS